MQVLRTPDERFTGLPGFPFAPHYAEIPSGDGGAPLRMHYLDEGPGDGPVVLLLHGEPSWCYLYRSMIPPLIERGFRCVAPDLIGFGRSDKPAAQQDYSYAAHVGWLRRLLVDELRLTGATLFAQDWGGLLGLRVLAEEPDRFARVVLANSGLPTGDHPPSEAFLAWQRFSRDKPGFQIGRVIGNGTASGLPDDVIAAYDAPFPDDSYTAGARIFPSLVPTSPDDPASDDNRRAWEVLERWEKPFLTAFSDGDPITSGWEAPFHTLVPGARDRQHPTIKGAGHFLQEDAGSELARIIIELVARTP
ncbi:haloalkane dehalogenase [Allosalinactinospora lopnorensis]|uniref:haloalkane dehalogenase n=1 Tax=Allosalinactinospora lopnorensis TaxID=1352348 RepID=UPI000623EFD7|nr:haloalkane dehalogenase [Allosalinactinospora lopnorensis]